MVKELTCSVMPSACACSVVNAAGTGPSVAVTWRGAGSSRTGSSWPARSAGSMPWPSTEGTTVIDSPDTSNRASWAGDPKAVKPSPIAVCSAAGSTATASVPSSWGVKVREAAIAVTGISIGFAASVPTTVTGAASAGVTVSSSTRCASAVSTRTGATSTGSSIGDAGSPPAVSAAVIASAAPVAVQGPALDRLDQDGVVPCRVTVASTGARSTVVAERSSCAAQRGPVDGEHRVDRRGRRTAR